MFDFERLELYQVVKDQNVRVLNFIQDHPGLDPYLADQWKKANLSIYLNLTEGSGRMSEVDKKNFITISRGCTYECAAIINLMKEMGTIDEDTYRDLYDRYESISRMLLGMYRSYNPK